MRNTKVYFFWNRLKFWVLNRKARKWLAMKKFCLGMLVFARIHIGECSKIIHQKSIRKSEIEQIGNP